MVSFINRKFSTTSKGNNIQSSFRQKKVIVDDILSEIIYLQKLLEEYRSLLNDIKYWNSQINHLRVCNSSLSLTIMEMLNSAGFNIYKASIEKRYEESKNELKKTIEDLSNFLIQHNNDLLNLKIYYEYNPPYVKDNAFYFNLGFLALLFSSVGYSVVYSNQLELIKSLTLSVSISIPLYFGIELIEFQQKHNWYSLFSSIKYKFNDPKSKRIENNLERVIKKFNKKLEQELSKKKSKDSNNQSNEISKNVAQEVEQKADQEDEKVHVKELPMSIVGLTAAIEWRLEILNNRLKKLNSSENAAE
ncbi:MAG: hypothetical protein QXF76_01995 [Candidatus Anstonellales archaeon]